MWGHRSENPNSADFSTLFNTLPHPKGWATDFDGYRLMPPTPPKMVRTKDGPGIDTRKPWEAPGAPISPQEPPGAYRLPQRRQGASWEVSGAFYEVPAAGVCQNGSRAPEMRSGVVFAMVSGRSPGAGNGPGAPAAPN